MTINELRTKRAKLWEGTKAFLDTHRNENGVLSAEDDAAYTRMEAEITALGREISRLERQEAMEAELSKPLSSPLTAKPLNPVKDEEEQTGVKSKAYQKSFWNAMRQKAILPEVQNALQEGTDSEGGYLVPDEFVRPDRAMLDVA